MSTHSWIFSVIIKILRAITHRKLSSYSNRKKHLKTNWIISLKSHKLLVNAQRQVKLIKWEKSVDKAHTPKWGEKATIKVRKRNFYEHCFSVTRKVKHVINWQSRQRVPTPSSLSFCTSPWSVKLDQLIKYYSGKHTQCSVFFSLLSSLYLFKPTYASEYLQRRSIPRQIKRQYVLGRKK